MKPETVLILKLLKMLVVIGTKLLFAQMRQPLPEADGLIKEVDEMLREPTKAGS